jgi:hypothetical protein
MILDSDPQKAERSFRSNDSPCALDAENLFREYDQVSRLLSP